MYARRAGREVATILVVDDEPLNRKLLRGWLAREHTVVEAADGDQALAAMERRPDAVLLDVMLPGRSGIEVLREIRRRPTDGFLPVVLLTALGDQEHRNAGLAAGADEYLSKPVDRKELALRLGALLRIRAQDAQIRRQLDQLRQLDAIKDDLVDLLVHDVRNPLSGLAALLETARERAEGRLRTDLDVAFEAATRAHDLLDDLLRIRRLEEASMPVVKEADTLGEVVRDAWAGFAAAASARGVAVELVADADPEVELDRVLVRRAVENLVGNAIRYAPCGSAVRVEVRPSDGGVELTVTDHGPGIDRETAARLFERFGTVGSHPTAAGKPVRKGFGLGLYLVRLVASAHGGTARASTPESGGARFHLWLPA